MNMIHFSRNTCPISELFYLLYDYDSTNNYLDFYLKWYILDIFIPLAW
jgi:hypothetical protein